MRQTMLLSLVLLGCAWCAAGSGAAEPAGGALAGDRPRVIISTDIGGSDPDDYQSMIHLLLYADALDLEGLISSPPGKGRVSDIEACLDAYARDFPTLSRHGNYPSPDRLRPLVKQGAVERASGRGWDQPTEGSRWIIERALKQTDRPLWVLVWGSMTDVAQAVHDEPRIKESLRVYSIGSWNTRQDTRARDYLFQDHRDLWWIESDTTFRGMYIGGNQENNLGNREFVKQHVRDQGALGALYWRQKQDIKMGDTPSLLYLLRGKPGDPTGPHWGGSFRRLEDRPHYWTDRPEREFAERRYPGARTVNRWREAYLTDWRRRMAPLQPESSSR